MPWTKLDDGFYDDPKVLEAGNEAVGVFCRALTYCGKQLTDGYVREDVALFLAGKRRPIHRLVEVGLWDRVDGGYLVVAYLRFNPSREQVETERARSRERMRRVRENGT